ncbi:hypothetical protein B0H16DRAFT_1530929 [Mycena metata]|uniref:Secreted protein n=1 Tax=Mycena metata TaxID=1033252 RepID=A0AAD7NHM1_9AGAR|nr:hypothetical protein B0H16DRAFT_1530929 [Mycena metata]
MVWVPAAWRGSLHASATLSFLLCPAAVDSDIALLELPRLYTASFTLVNSGGPFNSPFLGTSCPSSVVPCTGYE